VLWSTGKTFHRNAAEPVCVPSVADTTTLYGEPVSAPLGIVPLIRPV